ncbi:helix-turn-helix domain-containing protein [Methanohalophilus mahii]|uniref:ArsR family transcriptional regulator n=1 Tax=Methanohalophilus mahii TaxID=2176 RepID=UPI001FE0FE56|nr:ArsR family transcriptional regulator [Methanohalophilus mahii]
MKDILIEYPRLPLNNILTSSALTILAVLNNSCSISDIATKTGLNRKTVAYTIGQLAKYGIVLQENKKYFFSKRHSLIRSFVDNYWKYRTNKTLKEISPNAVLLWQRGPEILFKIDNDFIDSDKPVKKESIHPTAMNIFPKYGLKVISDLGYYFYSKRDLKAEDYVIHTLLIDPYSPIYNSYALALYSKTGSTELVKFGKLYDMEDHTKTLQEYLRIKEKNSSFLLPWNEFIDLIKDIQ